MQYNTSVLTKLALFCQSGRFLYGWRFLCENDDVLLSLPRRNSRGLPAQLSSFWSMGFRRKHLML